MTRRTGHRPTFRKRWDAGGQVHRPAFSEQEDITFNLNINQI